jgi:hypothetical protein
VPDADPDAEPALGDLAGAAAIGVVEARRVVYVQLWRGEGQRIVLSSEVGYRLPLARSAMGMATGLDRRRDGVDVLVPDADPDAEPALGDLAGAAAIGDPPAPRRRRRGAPRRHLSPLRRRDRRARVLRRDRPIVSISRGPVSSRSTASVSRKAGPLMLRAK